MKKGTDQKLKFKRLQAMLKLDLWEARGLLDALWDFVANNAPHGDVGRFTNEDIAFGIGWHRTDPDELVEALIELRWIDRNDGHRLVIHDWPEHCEDSIHLHLARRGQFFADGTKPKMGRMQKSERKAAETKYQTHVEHTANARHTHGGSTALPSPALPCHALPSQAPAMPAGEQVAGVSNKTRSRKPANGARRPQHSASVFAVLTRGDLADDARLLEWFRDASSRRKPVVGWSEANLIRVFGAAVRALEVGDKPVALFASIVAEAEWKLISAAQDDRARKRIGKSFVGWPPGPRPAPDKRANGAHSIGDVLSRRATA